MQNGRVCWVFTCSDKHAVSPSELLSDRIVVLPCRCGAEAKGKGTTEKLQRLEKQSASRP